MSSIALIKSKKFAVRIIKLSHYLKEQKKEYTLADQILRSGTSIGANLAEAECAVSRDDFRSKVYIALKESSETLYWLECLHDSSIIPDKMFNSFYGDCMELKRILTATTNTIRVRDK